VKGGPCITACAGREVSRKQAAAAVVVAATKTVWQSINQSNLHNGAGRRETRRESRI
jgi:hypothetical protein